MQTKFFDVPEPEEKPILRSKYQRFKWENQYRKANTEQKCKNCKHLFYNMPNCTGGGKYYKCELLGRSSSSATDIRLSNVCNRWEQC